jgi:hypothetical protein
MLSITFPKLHTSLEYGGVYCSVGCFTLLLRFVSAIMYYNFVIHLTVVNRLIQSEIHFSNCCTCKVSLYTLRSINLISKITLLSHQACPHMLSL